MCKFTYRFSARVLAALIKLVSTAASSASETLDGFWMEANNYPASSVLRFEKSGERWLGKYAQVSSMQQMWGFKVGETVMRGTLKGGVFAQWVRR